MFLRSNKQFAKLPVFYGHNVSNSMICKPTMNFAMSYIAGKKLNTIDRTLDQASKLENKGEYPLEFDLEEHFKMGFSDVDFEGMDERIKNVFTLNNASDREILDYRKNNAIRKFQKHPTDNASYAVRIAQLSEEIIHKIKYFYLSKRKNQFLYRTIQQDLIERRKVLDKARITEPNYYRWVCDEYKIKYDMSTVTEKCSVHQVPANKITQPNNVKGNRRRIRQSKNNYPKHWPLIR